MRRNGLPDMISVRHLLDLYGLRAQSQLSQNFLLNRNATGVFNLSMRSINICTEFRMLTMRRSHRGRGARAMASGHGCH